MSDNKPSELDLLRHVASAAEWVIESNGDDPVGRDGRSPVGINWISANGALNKALADLRELYGIENRHLTEREHARGIEFTMRDLGKHRKRQRR